MAPTLLAALGSLGRKGAGFASGGLQPLLQYFEVPHMMLPHG
jgi:hypothetical protein